MDIEQAATGYLKQYISRAPYLKAIINDNDKEPFFDGSILIYNGKELKNENFDGAIKIQIKGKIANISKIKDSIKYKIRITDLKGFLKSDGCIFFVICVSSNSLKSKGFFLTLKPLYLKELLNSKKTKQKTITMTLQELPENINTFTNIVRNTYKDCRLQRNQLERKNINITDLNRLLMSGFKISSNLSQVDNKIDYNFMYNYQHDFYLISPNGKPLISIENMNSILSITKHLNIEIWIDEKKYYSNYQVEEKGDIDIIIIGKSTKLVLNKTTCLVTINIDFKNAYYFDEYLNDMKFVVDMIDKKKIQFVNTKKGKKFKLPLDDRFKAESTIDVNNIKNKLYYLTEVNDMLNLLGINNDERLLINKLTVNDEKNIQMLVDNVIHSDYYKQEKEEFAPFCFINISNITLLLYVEKQKKGSKIFNPNTNRLNVLMKYNDERPDRKISPYGCLSVENISRISNFDFDDIYLSFTSIGNSNDINEFVIKLIGAYDLCGKVKFIYLIERLTNWVLENESDNELWHCVKLNKIQAKLRIEKINNDDYDYLNSIIYNENYSLNLKLGASLLLKNKYKFDSFFKLIGTKEQDEFVKYPIYTKFYSACK